MSETFSFEGRRVPFRPGQSVAAALIEAGERGFRETASGGTRSVFCGMGVCQDCLVEIGGEPNVRACMTKAEAGRVIRRQPARASLSAAPLKAGPARVETPDVLVIGGGAAGLEAAIAAARAGAGVLLLDERAVAGGQYYKQAAAHAPLDPQQAEGAALVATARAAGVEIRGGIEIWGAFDGPVFAATRGEDALILRPRATVVATGAYERPCLVPGWELPGVMTTGAAQTLWRSYRTLPGRRVVVAGTGPLNLQVAAELAAGGASVTGVAEAAPAAFTRPGAFLSMLAASPLLALKGLGLRAALAASGTGVWHGTRLTGIEREGEGLRAHFAGPGGRFTVAADAVLMNDGFHPSNEILRLLGCAFDWNGERTELVPVRSRTCETSLPGLFAAGDCCGLGGAPAARAEGRIAGAAAARVAGCAAIEDPAARPALARARAFQTALRALYAHARPRAAEMPPETLVCRCEEVTKAALDDALARVPPEPGAVKRATRIGMGRCQGRYCAHALVGILAERTGRPVDERAFFAPRSPVKPVRIAAILAAEEVADALRPPG